MNNNMTHTQRRSVDVLSVVGACAALVVMHTAAKAQTWNGASATTNNFSDGTNWVGGIAPVNNGTANLIFGGTTRLSPVVNVAYDVNGITFNNTAGAFNISAGTTLTTRGGGITNNDGTTQTISCPVIVGASQSWTAASGPMIFAGPIGLNAGLTLNNSVNSISLANAVSGVGSLTKSGNVSAFVAAASYTGPTLVTAGSLVANNNNAFSDASHVQLTGTGSLVLGSFTDAIPSLTSNTGTVVSITGGTLTLNANDGSIYTHGGSILGSGNVIKAGNHIAVFSAPNTFTGTTTVNDGTLRLSGSERLADSSMLVINTGGTVELPGATETLNTVSMVGGNLGSFSNPGGTIVANSFDLQGGSIRVQLSGPMSLVKSNGTFNAILSSGGHTYTGSTSVLAGTLVTNAPDVLPDGTNVTVTSPGILQISNFSDTIAGLSGNGTVYVFNATLSIGSGNASSTFAGTIADLGNTGGLTKIGGGTLFLSGANTYRGATTINSGMFYLIGNERLADNSPVVVDGGTFNSADETVSAVTLNGGTLAQTDAGIGQLRAGVFYLNQGTVNIPLANGFVLKDTTGTVILNTANALTNFYVNDGVVEIASDAALGNAGVPVNFNSGTLRVVTSLTIDRPFLSNGNPTIECQGDVVMRDYRLGVVSSSYGLIKTGPGRLTLNCTGVQTGFLSVQTGSVLIDSASSLPADSASTQIGGTLTIAGGLVRTSGFSFNSGTLTLSSGGRFSGGTLTNNGIIEGDGLISSTMINNASGDIRIAANESLDFTANTATTNSGLIDVIGGSAEFAARVNNQASTGLIFARNANLRFNGGLTNFGGMAISFGATDVFGDVDNRAGATITVSGASNATFVDDVINNGIFRTSGGGNSVFLGSVSGAGTFSGSGTVYLEGDLRPGNSPGLMTFGGDVFFGPLATLNQEIAGTLPSQFDRVQVARSVEIDGVLNVQFINGFSPAALQSFPIITSSALSGRFTRVNIPLTTPALNIKYTPTAVTLTTCLADFNDDGIVDLFDYLDFVAAFAGEEVSSDFNLDQVIDFFDYLDFVAAFSTGC